MKYIALLITGMLVWPVLRTIAEELQYQRGLQRYRKTLPPQPKAFLTKKK